eukprot:95693-Amphidinium_carterae.1
MGTSWESRTQDQPKLSCDHVVPNGVKVHVQTKAVKWCRVCLKWHLPLCHITSAYVVNDLFTCSVTTMHMFCKTNLPPSPQRVPSQNPKA